MDLTPFLLDIIDRPGVDDAGQAISQVFVYGGRVIGAPELVQYRNVPPPAC